jgi:hypothetical protein
MRILTLTFFMLMAVVISAQAQDRQPIDVEYPYFTGMRLTPLKYSVAGKELNHEELSDILSAHPDSEFYMNLAQRRKKVGLPLTIVGGVGLLTGILIGEGSPGGSSTGGLVVLGSTAVLVTGGFYLRGYGTNLQRAVNIYNKDLYQSQTTASSVSFHLTPLKTGLVWSF